MTWLLLAGAALLAAPVRIRGSTTNWERRLGVQPNGEVDDGSKSPPVLRIIGSVGTGVAVVLFLGGAGGILLALPAALAAWRVLSPRSDEDRRAQLQVARALPDAVALISALLRIGLPDSRVLRVVGVATPGPLGRRLVSVGRARELGQTVAEAWAPLGEWAATSPLVDAMVRSADSGAPVADLLDRVAVDARRDYHTAAQEAARSAGVRVVLPLGLCYLPSFLLLAVVPLVAALLTDIGW